MTAPPTHLRVEHLDEHLGVTVEAPRLSWRLPSDAAVQVAYQVRAGAWDSGRVESDESRLVSYAGPALHSEDQVEWAVKVWTDVGESPWSTPSWWEMGLLRADDWVAEWICPPADSAPAPHDVWQMRGSCVLPPQVGRARLHVTAQGIYEFFINGSRVGDRELTPGFTSYSTVLQVQSYDVTEMLLPGENVLGAVVSGGWLKWAPITRGAPVALLAQLHVYDRDGSPIRIGTDPAWRCTRGAVRAANLQEGQVTDFNEETPGWTTPGSDMTRWGPVQARTLDFTRLTGSHAPPVRRVDELRPIAMTRLARDRLVVDLGQNINGWIRLTRLGSAGTTLKLTHGEALDLDGDVTIDHLAGAEGKHHRPFQEDMVTSADDPDAVFEPRHTTHGFRYVRIEGDVGGIGADDVTGVVVHTDMRRTGWFLCNDERINRLHEAAVWSFRGNACDIPTDCPTRERAGWTGDWQIFAPTAAFLYDVAGFTAKWLRDLAADQRPDGVVWHSAPNPSLDHVHPPGSAGWGDAAVMVPWEIYRAYGDRGLLENQWAAMTAWVDYAARSARTGRHPRRAAARPVAAPHEQFLWDTGFHWGEWLEPGGTAGQARPAPVESILAELRAADPGSIATAYLHHSAHLLAKIATILGRDEEATRYRRLAAHSRQAWQAEYLNAHGTITPDTQASYVRALAFHLVPGELESAAASRLVELVRDRDTHLNTGFLATPYLLPVLADFGHLDVAHELLFQDTEPSWLTMIDRKATTVWEHWSGLDAQGQPNAPAGVGSLNHYSKGAVISFLHRYTAGIQILDETPGYRRFRVAPRPGPGIEWVRAAHDSPFGRIEVAWQIEDDEFTLEVTVPPGTTAEVTLPDEQTTEARPGTTRYRCSPPWTHDRPHTTVTEPV